MGKVGRPSAWAGVGKIWEGAHCNGSHMNIQTQENPGILTGTSIDRRRQADNQPHDGRRKDTSWLVSHIMTGHLDEVAVLRLSVYCVRRTPARLRRTLSLPLESLKIFANPSIQTPT